METKTNSQILSVGVIGTGGMGTRHALNLHRAVGNARVAAVYDLDQERARQVAGTCGQALVSDDPYRKSLRIGFCFHALDVNESVFQATNR